MLAVVVIPLQFSNRCGLDDDDYDDDIIKLQTHMEVMNEQSRFLIFFLSPWNKSGVKERSGRDPASEE